MQSGVAVLAREERFYAVASQELADETLVQGTWGKAFSVAVGDEQKARALYLKLRVDQLEREYQQSIANWLRDSFAEIASGKPFVCPYCEARTTAKRQEVDFLIQVFTEAPNVRYSCRSCSRELTVNGAPQKAKPATVPAANRRSNGMAVTGFILGLASVVFYVVGIIPILAVVFSGLGLTSFKPEAQKNKWMGGVGLALGIIYTVMMLNHYGYLK